MITFTKRKFCSFGWQRQHKQCSELLKAIYTDILDGKAIDEKLDYFNRIQEWIDLPPIPKPDIKMISDRYHFHLGRTFQNLREADFLPMQRKGDRLEGKPPWPITIYLDNLRSAHNVGSIMRTVEAFSLGTLTFSAQTPDQHHAQVKKTSMGASEWVSVSETITVDSLPKPIIALETSPEAVSVYEYPFPTTFTLVVGNEEYGCSDKLLHRADILIEIPLRGRKNSLNVANAFAIAAAEIARQKKEDDG